MEPKKRKHSPWTWSMVALTIAMLIWVRLRLVTDIPRAAYAEPDHAATVEPAGGQAGEGAYPPARVHGSPDAGRHAGRSPAH